MRDALARHEPREEETERVCVGRHQIDSKASEAKQTDRSTWAEVVGWGPVPVCLSRESARDGGHVHEEDGEESGEDDEGHEESDDHAKVAVGEVWMGGGVSSRARTIRSKKMITRCLHPDCNTT